MGFCRIQQQIANNTGLGQQNHVQTQTLTLMHANISANYPSIIQLPSFTSMFTSGNYKPRTHAGVKINTLHDPAGKKEQLRV